MDAKKQIVQGVVLTRTKVKNNILRIWNLAENSEKVDWYGEALDFACGLAMDYMGVDDKYLNKACGIIAALSPMKSWKQNKKIAEKCLSTGKFSGHTKAMLSKAQKIYESSGDEDEIMDILNGNKISAFYLNIRYPEKDISLTMDRHAICIALGLEHLPDEETPKLTVAQYEFFVQCYRWTANSLGITGTRLQSATWVAHRRLKKENSVPRGTIKKFRG